MAVGKTLAFVLDKTLYEIGHSSQAAQNQDIREQIKSLICDEQERLLDEFNWPGQNGTEDSKWFDIELAAGQRYYDWPDDFDVNTLTGVFYKFGGTWQPLTRGITLEDYSAFDSDEDVRADPPLKWDHHTDDQIEIWPIPVTDGNTLRVQGRRLNAAPVAENTVMVLDHIVLAKFAAAAFLLSRPDETGEARKLGQVKRGEASLRFATLKHRKNKGVRGNLAGANQTPEYDPRFRIRVVPTSN